MAFIVSKANAAIPFPFTFRKGIRSIPTRGTRTNTATRLMIQN
jgi:hypothetical protein